MENNCAYKALLIDYFVILSRLVLPMLTFLELPHSTARPAIQRNRSMMRQAVWGMLYILILVEAHRTEAHSTNRPLHVRDSSSFPPLTVKISDPELSPTSSTSTCIWREQQPFKMVRMP